MSIYSIIILFSFFQFQKFFNKTFSDVDIEDDEGLTPLHYACRISRKRKRKSKSRVDLFENSVASLDVSITVVSISFSDSITT